jgi:hypothetical protein
VRCKSGELGGGRVGGVIVVVEDAMRCYVRRRDLRRGAFLRICWCRVDLLYRIVEFKACTEVCYVVVVRT